MEQEERCPISDTHQRLHQTHLLWHQTERDYPDPDRFCVNLNAAITAMRSVTFVLQKQGKDIPDFAAWYGSWQTRLAADKLMVWMKNARNRIEKEGDLKTHSMARISLLAGWREPFPVFESAVDPLTTIDGAVDGLRKLRLPGHVLKEGVLLIERRWVAKDLNDRELLDVLAHCYGVLAQLVVDAHRQCGAVMRTFRADSHAPKPVRTEHLSGRLPCMVASEETRTAIFHLGIGKFISVGHEAISIDPIDAEKAGRQYGAEAGELGLRAGEDIVDASARWFEHAKRVLTKDGFHRPMMFLVMPDGGLEAHGIADDDRQMLYLSIRKMANHVERTGAVGVLHIAEFWHGLMADLKPGQRVADLPDRKEGLQVYAATSAGRRRIHSVEFTSNGPGKVEFGESSVEDGENSGWGLMEPFRLVWEAWKVRTPERK
jgi:hypothetical protein